MKQVGAFFAFHKVADPKVCFGAVRFDIGRDSNEDVMAIGLPMTIKCSTTRQKPEGPIVAFSMTFVTVRTSTGRPASRRRRRASPAYDERARAHVQGESPPPPPILLTRWPLPVHASL